MRNGAAGDAHRVSGDGTGTRERARLPATRGGRRSDRAGGTPQRSHDAPFLTRVALAATLATAAALALSLLPEVRSLERRIRRRAIRGRSIPERLVVHLAGLSGEPALHVPLTILIARALSRRDGWRRAAAVPLASLSGIAAHHAIKLVYRRQRPRGALRAGKREPAFPSGHTTQSTAVCLTVAYVLVRDGLADARTAAPLATIVPILTGIGRITKDMHWTTDVLGGWALGAALAAMAARDYERSRARR